MKLDVYDIKAEKKGSVELPVQFNEQYRPDLVKRAAFAIQSSLVHPYGSKIGAGMRASAKLSRKRRDYKTGYGVGQSRSPRKVLSRRGTRFNFVGANANFTVGGKRAHPPHVNKVILQKINDKERRKAIRCAISACIMKEIVARKHQVPEKYPFVLSSDFENMKKTAEVLAALKNLGLNAEIERVSERRLRAGKGSVRGRKYKTKKGPLIVVAKECSLEKIKNIPGVEIAKINEINSLKLAPGAEAGRLTLFTENAIKRLKEERLFV